MMPTPEEVASDLRRLGLPCPALPRLEPLPGDAGSRRYVRVRQGESSWMLMLVPEKPDRELGAGEVDGELPYLNVQRYLKKQGLPVPEVYGWLPETRRLYHEDFGSRHLTAAAKEAPDPMPFYRQAVDLLGKMQEATAVPAPFCVAFRRRFDLAGIRAELAEFAEAGLPHMAQRAPDPAEFGRLAAELDFLAQAVAALPAGFSHRDYHGDNLIVRTDGTLGIIDFQDAFIAPKHYDLASLLTDREAPSVLGYERIEKLIPQGEKARAFWTAALQRQMKVAGRFVNLARKGKPAYLDYLPATWGVIREALPRAGFLRLKELLASLGCPV